MATVILRPTDANVENLLNHDGDQGTVDAIADNSASTYLTTNDDSAEEASILSILFSTSQAYIEENGTINKITLNIQGKVLQDSPIPLQYSLTCTHRGSQGANIQSPLTAFTAGTIALVEQYSTLTLSPVPFGGQPVIDEGHIDTLVANISVNEGSFLISEVFIEVNYNPKPAGRIEIFNGSISLNQGRVSIF